MLQDVTESLDEDVIVKQSERRATTSDRKRPFWGTRPFFIPGVNRMCQTETTRSDESEQEEYLVEGSAGDGVSLDVGPDDDVPPSLGGKDRPGRIRVAGAIPVVGRRVLFGGRRHLSHQYVPVGERSEEEDRTCKGILPQFFPRALQLMAFRFHVTNGNLKSQAM